MKYPVMKVVGATAALTCLSAGVAHADVIKNDVVSDTGVGGIRRVDTGQSTTINYHIQATGKADDAGNTCDAADGSPVTVTIDTPAGVTASPSSLMFSACDMDKSVTFSANTAGKYAITHTASDENGSYNESPANFFLDVSAPEAQPAPDADGDGIPDDRDTNSYAPKVGIEAGPANGNEGNEGNPRTSGSFTDQDPNGSLTITKVEGAGTVLDKGDGTFFWSHTTRDDAEGSVTVEASDGEHAPATQTFSWTADNVAPVIESTTPQQLGACRVGLATGFSDAGLDDTHDVAVDWGDGSNTDAAGNELSVYQVDHAYSSAGTYNGTVTVTDDNGGQDVESLASHFTAYNTPSSILQPINTNGARSTFKIGSTIPVKITVTGCDGGMVKNLTPDVHLVQKDATTDSSVNETAATMVATNGKEMRWDESGQQYIYNLSTKLSQFTGGQLTAGTWKVSVSDPTFYGGPVNAMLDLRK